ncbi:MAG TPA: SAVED domain-containing protein [Solirubrobacterales bacterium]|nr:SAVED domain-containing protein [Solirubrobacterales bacterium]
MRLWVAAGGRCEYRGCNEYLLEDELTGYALNLAERAHIVGAAEGAGSPRGKEPLDPALRNEEPNLMLLCRKHHRVIDGLITEHGVEGLRAMKREHEERIRLLTSLSEDASSVIVRMSGGIRGAPVEIPCEAVRAAVLADGRFPRFRAALAGEDLEIDLRKLPGEEEPDYWKVGERMIAEQTARLREAQEAVRHVSVFALARLPLLVALGFHLDDKIPVTVYPRARGGSGDGEWGFDDRATPTAFSLSRLAGGQAEEVALSASLTGPIGDDVLAHAEGRSIYEIEPEGVEHSRDLFSARESLDAFAETYHRFLALVEREHPACKEISIYLACPAPAAVQIGRGLMRNAQPRLVIYDRNASGDFERTLEIG